MLGIEHDAVLVIVHIGAVLQEPICPGNPDRNDPVILPCRVIHPAGIALILRAELALGIAGLGGVLRSSDSLGIFFRFRLSALVSTTLDIVIVSKESDISRCILVSKGRCQKCPRRKL